MRVRVLPALSDNYMYLLVDNKTNQAAIVDPVEPDIVMKAVEEAGTYNGLDRTNSAGWELVWRHLQLIEYTQAREHVA